MTPRPLLLSLFCLSLFACSPDIEDDNARELIRQARALSSSEVRSDQEQALTLLDSLHRNYSDEIALRKEALNLSRQIKLRMSENDLATFREAYSQDSILLIRMDPLFVRSKHPGMPKDETVMRYKGYKPEDRPGVLFLDLFLTHDASLRIVAGTSGKSLPTFTSLKVYHPESGAYEVSDTIPTSDQGRNYTFAVNGEKRRRLTLSPEGAERIAAFVALHSPDSEVTNLRLSLQNNGNPISTYTLTPSQISTIKETYRFYAAYIEMKTLEEKIRRHMLYRRHVEESVHNEATGTEE